MEPSSRTRASVDVLALDAASSKLAIARGVASSAAMFFSARSPCSRFCNLAAVSAVAAVATSCAHAFAAARDVTSPNAAPSGACVVARSSSSLDGDDREGDGVPSPRATRSMAARSRRMGATDHPRK